MIPVELRLTNFMSYKYMDEPLSFSSIHTAVLCGPNGHGKSSLLDAITWAVWGRARGVDKRGAGTDDLIHHRESHMQVEFTFELEGQNYRVIRSRSRSKKTGTSRLEFQVLNGAELKPLTGENINETQAAINRTLRMDYETFINSAFVMQGRADSFMTKSANERKEILSEILGLSVYDELEELAREKRKAQNDSIKDIDSKISYMDAELESLPAYTLEAEMAIAELTQVQAEIRTSEQALLKLREQKAALDLKATQLSELDDRNAKLKGEIASLDKQLQGLKESAAKASELVARQDEIEAFYNELSRLRAQEEKMSADGQSYTALDTEANSVRIKIAQEKSFLESNLKHLFERKAQLEKELLQKDAFERELRTNKSHMMEFDKLEQDLSEMRKRYTELKEKRATLATKVQTYSAKLEADEKAKSLLTGGADTCPLCKKGLDEHESRDLRLEMEREISELRCKIDACNVEAAVLNRELQSLEETGKQLSEKLQGKTELQVKEGKLAEKIRSLDKASQEVKSVVGQLAELNLNLKQNVFAQSEQSELNRLQAKMEQLGYNPEEHVRIKERLRELARFETLKANLEGAQATIKMTTTTISALSVQRDDKIKALAEDEQKIADLSQELARAAEVLDDISTLGNQLLKTRNIEASTIQKRSAAQAKIDGCKALAKQKQKLNRARKEAAKEAEIYDKLAFIFSKKGIPALVIENTVPEIEEEANALLHKLTGGQMSLRFVTQKGQKTGGVIETLDLIITDGDLGDRKYELFSGGEAFRINFAVRIALSKLLSRRAGARLETLVIDEGFGTQDEEGKDRLVEAISAIQDDFKKIIIVTHLDDLKETFPARIEVTKKRGAGSIAAVI